MLPRKSSAAGRWLPWSVWCDLPPAYSGAWKARQWRHAFESGWDYFQQKNWDVAEQQFRLTINWRKKSQAFAAATSARAGDNTDSNPEGATPMLDAALDPVIVDGPSLFYLQIIEQFRQKPPSSNWFGEVELAEK